eukprot:9779110-Heterocapsa_arctica.AAC.1
MAQPAVPLAQLVPVAKLAVPPSPILMAGDSLPAPGGCGRGGARGHNDGCGNGWNDAGIIPRGWDPWKTA